VIRGLSSKDATMRSKLLLIALCASVAACNTPDLADKGLSSVHVPVVTTADYVFDAATSDGGLAPGQGDRLNGWFQGLGLGYGDTIYVDGGYSPAARGQVAAIAGEYGMRVADGAPVTAGMVQPDTVRIVVSRRRAVVPGCPNWSLPSQPNYDNRTISNFGCGVNSGLAMQVANPEDLVRGRDGSAASDSVTGAKAVLFYRSTAPTGAEGLMEISTKKDKK
jgi:pilus assembly protein CpaD